MTLPFSTALVGLASMVEHVAVRGYGVAACRRIWLRTGRIVSVTSYGLTQAVT